MKAHFQKVGHNNFQFILFAAIFIFLMGCNRKTPPFWHSNGTMVKNITWEIFLDDSSSVLRKLGDVWILPQPPDSVAPQVTYTTYRNPSVQQYKGLLGRVDQEVVHSKDTNIVEFYRFENGGVFFLGFTNPDTSKPLTFFEPPLLILPSNLTELEKPSRSSGTMKTLAGHQFDNGFKSTYTISRKQAGRFHAEDGTEREGILCESTISRDASIQFGHANLIVPDEMMVGSNIIFDKKKAAVIEWGIRTRNAEIKSDKTQERERELYIEITIHQIQ